MKDNIKIKVAESLQDFSDAKKLILEYATWLNIDLSFQNFGQEMATLHEMYNRPNGALFLAMQHNKAIGVVGLRKFSEKECEIKRMFVQPKSRGLGVGRLLIGSCISMAKVLQYDSLKLDTINLMKDAIKLYIENGFTEIPSYRFNPDKGARYFKFNLK